MLGSGEGKGVAVNMNRAFFIVLLSSPFSPAGKGDTSNSNNLIVSSGLGSKVMYSKFLFGTEELCNNLITNILKQC